jgi:hypothetical protein
VIGGRLPQEPIPTVHVYEAMSEETARIVTEQKSLDGGAVLPEFGLPLADVFSSPL